MLFTSKESTPLGDMFFVGDEEALYLLEFADAPGVDEELIFIEKELKKKSMPGSTKVITLAKQQVKEYFSRDRFTFTVPIKTLGTPFQKKVWRALIEIEHGTIVSYGEVAKKIKREKAFRAVGTATGRNSLALLVPCHRVLAANGLGGYKGGLDRKKWLLEHEGVLKYGSH